MSISSKILDFFSRKKKVKSGGGQKAIAKQVSMGKMTARDRISTILDPGSFHEIDLFVEHNCKDFNMDQKELAADGVVTGTGTICGGYPVCIYAQDFTVVGGSLGLAHARKITKVMDLALNMGVPLIGINDSGGARVQTEITGNAHFFANNERECFDQIKRLMSYIPWNDRKKADPLPTAPPKPGKSTSVSIGKLKALQYLMNLAILSEESTSSTPAR